MKNEFPVTRLVLDEDTFSGTEATVYIQTEEMTDEARKELENHACIGTLCDDIQEGRTKGTYFHLDELLELRKALLAFRETVKTDTFAATQNFIQATEKLDVGENV